MRFVMMAMTIAALAGCSGGAEAPDSAESTAIPTATATADATPTPTELSPTASSPEPATSAEPFPVQFQALGTEPFWSLAVDGTTATYSTPDNISGETSAAVRSESGGALTVTGALTAGAMRLAVTRATCSDGMSDTVYPFTARLTVGTLVLEGCARPGLPRRATQ